MSWVRIIRIHHQGYNRMKIIYVRFLAFLTKLFDFYDANEFKRIICLGLS